MPDNAPHRRVGARPSNGSMITIRRLRALVCVLACCVFADLCYAEGAAPPADATPFPPDQKACVLVVGDGGASTVLPDPSADKAWVEADRSVTSAFIATLAKNGYATTNAFIEQAQRSATHSPVVPLVMAARCARTLQITHWVGSDAQGPCVMFTATVSHMLKSASGAARGNAISIPIDFVQSYRFAASPEAVRTNALAEAMLSDLRASGQIEFARLGTLPDASVRAQGDETPAPTGTPLLPVMPVAGVRTCALVVGGLGKPAVELLTARAWEEMSRFVTDSLYEVIDKGGHAVQKVFIEQSVSDRVPPAWIEPLAKSRCAEVITVADALGADEHGPFVLFYVVAYHFTQDPVTGKFGTVNDFAKPYRYSRDPATVGSLSALAISRAAVEDMRAAGILDLLRPASPPADKQLVAKAYGAMLAKWNLSEYHVRRILLPDEAAARAAIVRIQGGEPFEALAKTLSIDQESGRQGGDLQWALPSSYESPLAHAIAKAKAGRLVEEPVHGATGWNVIEVLGVRPKQPPPFDDVQLRLDERLRVARDAQTAGAGN